jgi:hypothetical protein
MLAIPLLGGSIASAQVTPPVEPLDADTAAGPPDGDVPPFVIPGKSLSANVVAENTFESDLKGGGTSERFKVGASVSLDTGFLALDGSRPAGPQDITGPLLGYSVSFGFNALSFDLDQLGPQGAAFGLSDDLLEQAYSFNVNPRLTIALDKASSLAVGGFFSFAFEEGADVGDSFTPGGFIGYRRVLNEQANVLVGVAAFAQLDDSTLVVPIISLNIDRGPGDVFFESQGLGLRGGYRFDDRLALSVGAKWEGNDFRLEQDDLILINRRLTVDVAAEYQVDDRIQVGVTIGSDVYTNYELVEDSGNELFDVEAEPGLLVSAFASLRL